MRMRMGVAAAALALLCGNGFAGAPETPVEQASEVALKSDSSDLGISPLRMIAVAGLIGSLIYLTALGLRRYSRWSRTATSAKRSLQVIDSLPLGGKRVLLVTRVYDRILLIGAGDGPLVKLGEIEDPGVVEEAGAAGEHSTEGRRRFQDLLAAITRSESREPEREITPHSEYERMGRSAPQRPVAKGVESLI